MALRLQSGQYLNRTSGLPVVTAFTIMGWSRVAPGGSTIVVFEAGGFPEFYFNYVPADTTYYFGAYNGGAFPGSNFTTGLPGTDTWFHWYVKRSGSALEAGFRAVGSTAYTSATLTIGTTATLASMRVNTDPFGGFGDGRYEALKVWDAALSADEILNESIVLRPVRFTNLHLWTPAVHDVVASAAIDFSGAGKNWTVNGTPTIEDGPPISWGGASVLAQDVPATTGSSVAPGKGSLAYTGYAPTLITASAVAPGKGALAYTGYAPALVTPSSVAPGKGSLTYTGYQPTIPATFNVAPGAGSLVYTGFAPTLLIPSRVAPGKGSLTYTGFAPSLIRASSVAPGKGSLAYTGYAPTVVNSGYVVRPGKGSLVYRGFAPSLLGLRREVQLIPPMQNLDLVRQRANTILEYLQRGLATYATALPPAADYSDGALFADMKAKKLYQLQGGAWVEAFAKSFVRAFVSGVPSISVDNAIPYSSEVEDALGEYNPATFVFTAKFAGNYFVHAEAQLSLLAAGKFAMLEVRRGVTQIARGVYDYVEGGIARGSSIQVTALVKMAAGETMYVALLTDDSPQTIVTSYNSHLEIHQL